MRRAIIMLTTLIALAALTTFALTRSPKAPNRTQSAEPNLAPISQPFVRKEEQYAPPHIISADIKGHILSIKGQGTPDSVVHVNAPQLLVAQTNHAEINVEPEGGWALNIPLPQASQRPPIIDFNLTSRFTDGTHLRSDQHLTIITHTISGHEAIAVIRPGGATRVLRLPFDHRPQHNGLSLEAADYDDKGGVIFSGHSSNEGRIRIQANGIVIGETGLDEDSNWALIAGATLPVGTYSLRIQCINFEGHVEAQLILPFNRAAPQLKHESEIDIAAAAGKDITVTFDEKQWILSRDLYAGGSQHTVIYSSDALK